MLIAARQAPTANKYAPRRQRSSFAAGQLRWYFGPSIKLWIDAVRDRSATGNSVAGTKDRSGADVSITQTTASKQPIKDAVQGIHGFKFDGVNDALQVAAINNTATSAISVVCAYAKNTGAQGVIIEASINANTSATGWNCITNDTIAGQDAWAFQGNVGYGYRSFAGAAVGSWTSSVCVINKALASGQEIKIYRAGNEITQFVATIDSNNTNAFGTDPIYIGSRNNGAALPTTASISQVILLGRALTAAEAKLASILVGQAAGIP